VHYWTLAIGDIPEELQPIVDHNVAKWDMEIVRLDAITDLEGIALVEELTRVSDIYRHERAANNTDYAEAYLDLDCKLLMSLDEYEPEALPYWPEETTLSADKQPDTFIMIVSPGAAQRALDIAAEKGGAFNTGAYCWPRRVWREFKGITQIDPSCYEHGMYSVKRRRALQAAAKA